MLEITKAIPGERNEKIGDEYKSGQGFTFHVCTKCTQNELVKPINVSRCGSVVG